MQIEVNNSPFNEEQSKLLKHLLSQMSNEQKLWLSGFLAAASQQTKISVPEMATSTSGVTVLYGSQTGNAQHIAGQLSKQLEASGFKVSHSAMSDFKTKELKNTATLLIIVSTHGEGDPPDNAVSFHEFLHSRKAPKLPELKYAVLALGDSSYEFYCHTGRQFDERLSALGAQQLLERVDCDVDFDESAAAWISKVLETLKQDKSSTTPASITPVSQVFNAIAQTSHSRQQPFQAEVLENINLNGRGSDQETRHLELSLEDAGFQYEPGDCLGIYPQNDPQLVDRLLELTGWEAQQPIPGLKNDEQLTLRDGLLQKYEISLIGKPLLEHITKLTQHEGLNELLQSGNEKQLREYANGRDLLDLLEDFSLHGLAAEDCIAGLRKIPPRLYSIASSQLANPEEVHVTIRAVRYHANGRERGGVCSLHCAERLQPGERLPVFIQHNPNFKLPDDPAVPIIMVGPGTGIAPFRAFMEHREETAAAGKSWLFFGDRRFRTDFLYQTDWQRWLKQGVLTRMDVAFSRDAAEKVYVQHRMLENSLELYRWLEEGAHLYVCGDKEKMARDVHQTLLAILEREGHMDKEAAEGYAQMLLQQKRYQRDIY